MLRAEPHPRQRRARRAAVLALAAGIVLGTPAVARAQTEPTLLPTTTTTEPPEEPTTSTTSAPVLTTTTESDESPATSLRTTTSVARQTTTTTVVDEADDGDEADDEVDDSVPEETSTTGRNLLVPGDGSDGAQLTTTSTTAAPEVASDSALDEETQIWLIVAGLVAVALLIGAWTVRYWRRTRPAEPVEAEAAEADPTTVFGAEGGDR